MELNDANCKARRMEYPPTGYGPEGRLTFSTQRASEPAPYIVWDASREAPPGFGLKVGKKKTFILRRKVMGKSILAKVGNFADYLDNIKLARAKAAEMARTMVETRQNPNALAREANAAEATLEQAMQAYREHWAQRTQRPATAESLRVYDRVMKRHREWGWAQRKVREISDAEIIRKFLETHKQTPTATEQAFRWPSRAIDWLIENEKIRAEAQGREVALKANPFRTLAVNGYYRTKDQIDSQRHEQGKRNPLSPQAELGPFIEALWSKKDLNDNQTGCHYLLLMLLWGCRKSEHAGMVWGELLPEHGPGQSKLTCSHVALSDPKWGPYAFFYKTKNGRSHRLPIAPMALELLKRRQLAAAEESVRRGFEARSRPFVFPARSKFSRTGHYMDATDLLDDLREEVRLARLNRHDLRRSFGAVMTALDVPEVIKRRFLNHAGASVTDTYTQAEWQLLRDWMARIEQAILSKAPNAYNSLKPADWPPLPAPAPHVCRPPKPRTGRPRKASGLEGPNAKSADFS